MFGAKKKIKKNDESAEITLKVNSDLLVRNMPSLAKLTNTSLSSNLKPAQASHNVLSSIERPTGNKHQTVGILIILGGCILIGALVYLSYIFIIKPQAASNVKKVVAPEPAKNSVINIKPATSSEEIITPVASIVATITPTALGLEDIASTTTMAEESTGRNSIDLPPLLDTDSDGLIDDEETVLGANPNAEDSNNNNYKDAAELANNYDPAGSGKIETNKYLAKYADNANTYDFLYPKDWEFSILNNNSIIIFNSPDDSIIQVSVQENTTKQAILAWYNESFPDSALTSDRLKSTGTWDGVMSDDGLNFYLTDKKKANIYVISYIPAVMNRLAYPNIFKLMINSLVIK
ncbi:MAG: hypothetical protein ACOYL8_02030 [Patescibacteria group bacterium]